jgi:hypothetical protein
VDLNYQMPRPKRPTGLHHVIHRRISWPKWRKK